MVLTGDQEDNGRPGSDPYRTRLCLPTRLLLGSSCHPCLCSDALRQELQCQNSLWCSAKQYNPAISEQGCLSDAVMLWIATSCLDCRARM